MQSNENISVLSVLAQPVNISFADFIQSKLEEMGITKNYLCKAVKIDNKSLMRILNGEAQKVDVVTILKIGDFMGIDYREFVERYISELKADEIGKIHFARKAGIIIRNFDLDNLQRIGWIHSKSDFENIEKRILKFFGLESLRDYEQGLLRLAHLFSQTRRNPSEKMLKFWCMTAERELKAIPNPYPLDLNLVKEVMARLSILTSDEVGGLLKAVRTLFRAGVTVLVNPYIGRSQVQGATFVVNDKPGIVLQDYRNSYDTIWFALAHELCHVIKDLKLISDTKYHLTIVKGNDDLFIDNTIEDRANAFASELLLPEKKMTYISGYIDIPGMVKKYAAKWQVSESIIYGQYAYRYDKKFYYGKTKKAEIAIRELLVKNLYEEEEIQIAMEQVKDLYN